ncbi:hypothetical protein H2203_000222 [Taxawa tesnikishii (nom. ined.)]|nr:hypothetical protein H2203_000222 [Dothideales sp. JES 119]
MTDLMTQQDASRISNPFRDPTHACDSRMCCSLTPYTGIPHPEVELVSAANKHILDGQTKTNGKAYRFFEMGHECTDLVTQAVNSFASENEEHKSIHLAWGIQQWNQWKREHLQKTTYGKLFRKVYLPYDPQKRHALYGAIQSVIPIFSAIFFLGGLSNAELFFLPMKNFGEAERKSFDGDLQITDWYLNFSVDQHAKYYPVRSVSSPDGGVDGICAKKVLGTVLHEMCHIFIDRHSCRGTAYGCGNEQCWKRFDRMRGLAGHGPVWLWLANNIERQSGVLLDLNCDLVTTTEIYREAGRGELLDPCTLPISLINGIPEWTDEERQRVRDYIQRYRNRGDTPQSWIQGNLHDRSCHARFSPPENRPRRRRESFASAPPVPFTEQGLQRRILRSDVNKELVNGVYRTK